jgi:hypothetical protein
MLLCVALTLRFFNILLACKIYNNKVETSSKSMHHEKTKRQKAKKETKSGVSWAGIIMCTLSQSRSLMSLTFWFVRRKLTTGPGVTIIVVETSV